ncbi:hypothetical protein DSUL_100100 [Desulfovibrionales bacterium]
MHGITVIPGKSSILGVARKIAGEVGCGKLLMGMPGVFRECSDLFRRAFGLAR